MKIAQVSKGWQPITLTLETPQEANLLKQVLGSMSAYQDEQMFKAPGMTAAYGFLDDALEGYEDELPHVAVTVAATVLL